MYENERAVIDFWKMNSYLEKIAPPRPAELAVMEAYAEAQDFPIVGPLVGRLCYLIARLTGATRVFELGSGYGYSTAWFAQAVRENVRDGGNQATGVIHHTVWAEALSAQARQHLEVLGYSDLVHFHIGEAVGALTMAEGPFDIIFMDIDKPSYPGAIGEIQRKLRRGGVLIVDNMLWSGRLWDMDNRDAATLAIRKVAEIVNEGVAWAPVIVPLRDGVLVARYNGE